MCSRDVWVVGDPGFLCSFVFAELLGPLNSEISTLLGSENKNEEQISSPMLGVNELLAAAKESEAYKSIEETLSLTYFNFLQEVHDLTVKIGTRAFDVWFNGDVVMPVTKKKKRSRDSETKKKSEAIFSEVVFALLHLLELEYRVFEQQLPSVWMFMFKILAPTVEVMRTTSKASEFACGLISMYSNLRQVEILIFHLTNTLTDLQSFGARYSLCRRRAGLRALPNLKVIRSLGLRISSWEP